MKKKSSIIVSIAFDFTFIFFSPAFKLLFLHRLFNFFALSFPSTFFSNFNLIVTFRKVNMVIISLYNYATVQRERNKTETEQEKE